MITIRKGKKDDVPFILDLIKELAEYENALDQVSIDIKELEIELNNRLNINANANANAVWQAHIELLANSKLFLGNS